MGAGSGGFYAAQAAMKQAARSAGNSTFNRLDTLFPAFAFLLLLSLLGIVGVVIGACIAGVLLMGFAKQHMYTLATVSRRQLKLRLAAWSVSVFVLVCGGVFFATRHLPADLDFLRHLGIAIAYLATYGAFAVVEARHCAEVMARLAPEVHRQGSA